MKSKDPKYIGVPNICFSLTDSRDNREKEFAKQRMSRGFDDSETWSLTDTISCFMIPRLEAFLVISEKQTDRHDFHERIRVILKALRLITRDNGTRTWTKDEESIVNKGLKYLPGIFLDLWW